MKTASNDYTRYTVDMLKFAINDCRASIKEGMDTEKYYIQELILQAILNAKKIELPKLPRMKWYRFEIDSPFHNCVYVAGSNVEEAIDSFYTVIDPRWTPVRVKKATGKVVRKIPYIARPGDGAYTVENGVIIPWLYWA